MTSPFQEPAMDDKGNVLTNYQKLPRCNASKMSDVTFETWCQYSTSGDNTIRADCIGNPAAQEIAISHLKKKAQGPHDTTHNYEVDPNNKNHQSENSNNVIGTEATQTFVENLATNGEHLLNTCGTTNNGTSISVDGPVVKAKARRVPSTPSLIVSDTSTGRENCVLKSTVLPNRFFDDKVQDPTSTCDSKQSSLDDVDSYIGTENMTESENNSPVEVQSAHGHLFLTSKRSCDSAYGSSLETVLVVPHDDASPASSITDNDVVMDNINSRTPLSISSAEDSPNHSSYGTSLSVCLPSKNSSSEFSSNSRTPLSISSAEDSPNHSSYGTSLSVCLPSKNSSSEFSSNSSIASDTTTDIPCGAEDSGSSSNLQIDRDVLYARKLSSSNFSLRSSLSFEESEEDFASGDDSSLQVNLSRRNSKIKAQRSWTKLRRMVIWSPFMQSFKRRYPWVQLAGHAGNFQPGAEGCILKKYVKREAECLKGLTADPTLREFAPTFHDIVHQCDETYTRMQDLLMPFDSPSLMDCKMGIRTYLEDELVKAKIKPRLRHDMYLKMVEISPDEPTPQERKLKAVTKPRYMQWREHVSSTSNLGFRIEGIKKSNKEPSKDYKLTKTFEQVAVAFNYFIDSNTTVLEKYIERLKRMRVALEKSDFFHSHEAIGSSLLFVHDNTDLANIWMIDFGKTSRLPEGQKINHRNEWVEGNREDGYLFGMDNMILLFEGMLQKLNSEPMFSAAPPSREGSVSSNPGLNEKQTMVSQVSITITAPRLSSSSASSKRQAVKRQLAQSLSDEDFPSQLHSVTIDDDTIDDVANDDISEPVFVERTS